MIENPSLLHTLVQTWFAVNNPPLGQLHLLRLECLIQLRITTRNCNQKRPWCISRWLRNFTSTSRYEYSHLLFLNVLLTIPGQINVSLTSFSRTLDDYNKLAKQEIQTEKQQKAYERIKNFRSELTEYRDRFDRLKQELDERVSLNPYERQE